uniref:Uncharacterized protein n=1 Tax=Zea mays TaxID=4577 RepID=C4IYR1_MAIZE|nr:unknown [Zea mays]
MNMNIKHGRSNSSTIIHIPSHHQALKVLLEVMDVPNILSCQQSVKSPVASSSSSMPINMLHLGSVKNLLTAGMISGVLSCTKLLRPCMA